MKEPGTCMLCSKSGAKCQDGIEKVEIISEDSSIKLDVIVPIWVCSCGFSWTEDASRKKAINSHLQKMGVKTTNRSETMGSNKAINSHLQKMGFEETKRSETMGSNKKNQSRAPVVTVKELVVAELADGGFDGLISASGSCCCYLDNGTCPCPDVNDECIAGNITLLTCDVRKIGPLSIGPLSVEKPWEIVKVEPTLEEPTLEEPTLEEPTLEG